MLEDYDRAEALVLWLLELFPRVYATMFEVKYVKTTDRIEWKIKKSKRDNTDIFNLIFYGVKREFFKKVVGPRLEEKIAGISVTAVWAGTDRVIIHFEPDERRVWDPRLGNRLRNLDTLERDCWPQRSLMSGSEERPPPQE